MAQMLARLMSTNKQEALMKRLNLELMMTHKRNQRISTILSILTVLPQLKINRFHKM